MDAWYCLSRRRTVAAQPSAPELWLNAQLAVDLHAAAARSGPLPLLRAS
jgi:hypothetical protein